MHKPRLCLYEYKGVAITRIDKASDCYLYFGKFTENDKLPKEYYIGKYRGGFDADFSAYLSFKNDSVELIRDSGIIEKIGINKRFYMREGYELKTDLDTVLYKKSSPYTNCTFNLVKPRPYDTRKYYLCELIGTTNEELILKRFIDSISVHGRMDRMPSGKVFYDKSLAMYNIRYPKKNEHIIDGEGTYGSVVYLDYNIDSEIKVNKANKSKVKAIY